MTSIYEKWKNTKNIIENIKKDCVFNLNEGSVNVADPMISVLSTGQNYCCKILRGYRVQKYKGECSYIMRILNIGDALHSITFPQNVLYYSIIFSPSDYFEAVYAEKFEEYVVNESSDTINFDDPLFLFGSNYTIKYIKFRLEKELTKEEHEIFKQGIEMCYYFFTEKTRDIILGCSHVISFKNTFIEYGDNMCRFRNSLSDDDIEKLNYVFRYFI